MVWVHGVSASALYVLRKAVSPMAAAKSTPWRTVPTTKQPVVFVKAPGGTPTSPVITPGAVQVTFVLPRTAKVAAAPSDGVWARARLPILNTQITNKSLFI